MNEFIDSQRILIVWLFLLASVLSSITQWIVREHSSSYNVVVFKNVSSCPQICVFAPTFKKSLASSKNMAGYVPEP